jgi:hypothetical protein
MDGIHVGFLLFIIELCILYGYACLGGDGVEIFDLTPGN